MMPPRAGPTASEMPETPAQMPMAWALSLGSMNVFVRMARVEGIMTAAPSPWTALPPIKISIDGREGAEQRGRGEDDEARQEGPLAAVDVAQGAAREHEGRQQQREGVDDPLQFAEAGVQLPLDGGQREVHHGVVEHDHEQAEADGSEREQFGPAVLLEHPLPC